MSDDLPIKISLDPTQAAGGAKAITTEVAKLETQAEETKGAMARLGASLKNMAAQASEGLTKAGLSFKDFSQGLKEIGKGQAMMAIKDGLSGITSQIKELTGIPIGGSGTAIGYMLGGPAGAAVGTLVEGMNEGFDSMRKMVEEEARLQASTTTLGNAIAAFTTKANGAWAAMTGLTTAFSSQSGVLGEVKQKIDDYNTMLDLSGASAAKNYHDQIDALNRVIKDHPEQADLAREAIERLNGSHVKAASSAKAQVDQMNALRDAVGNYGRVARNAEWAAEDAARAEENDPTNMIGELGGGPAINVNKKPPLPGFAPQGGNSLDGGIKQATVETTRLQREMKEVGAVMSGPILSAAQSLTDTIIDAANGAKVSWTSTLESIASGFAKAAAQALVLKLITGSATGTANAAGGYGGLFGLMGFASGGTIYPSGSGSTDSMSVSFRKRPDETVHINTPMQEAAYQRGGQGGGSTTVQVVDGRDPRALMQGGADVQRVVLDTIRANPSAVRALLGR